MKVLLVEDEERIASFICRGLEEEGYAVEVCSDGERGLMRAVDGRPDLIILDLMLPKRDGLDVLRSLRSKDTHVPVLILTARDGVEARVAGLDSGADDYLAKPFAFDELLARLRALLRRTPTARPPALSYADIVLDPATRTVTRRGRTIDLSPREFALLEYFLRHPEHVLSRTRIFEHVWQGRYDGLSNVVDVYVNYLRRKLESAGEERVIATVRGHGYALRRSQ
ncbi:MAG TPA: response regulator transcription factor [Planctomycetota bacterium]|nr:response regulator transcription factor [Planctomycetota bacterium]